MESGIGIDGLTTIIQSLPNHGVKSLSMDSFLCGFLCGQNEGIQFGLGKALTIIQSVNSQLSEKKITFEQKIAQYNQIISELKNTNRSQIQVNQTPQKKKIMIIEDQEQPLSQPYSNVQPIQGLSRFHSTRLDDCQICLDMMRLDQLFPLSGCTHLFHKSCLKQHILSKTEQSIFPLLCPVCSQEIKDQDLKEILDGQQYDKYLRLQYFKFINENEQGIQRCYTPECDYLFIKADNFSSFQCPKCKLLQCVPCKSLYHEGVACTEYQRMKLQQNPDENDRAFFDLARQVRMRQCSQCQHYVEKSQGCDHMTCICGYQFCYVCGGRYNHCECIQQRPQPQTQPQSQPQTQSNLIWNLFQQYMQS